MKKERAGVTMDSNDPHNKRRHILDAAYRVFSRKGYHRATVDEIIALADTGKGTVYNYFVNKEHLFYSLIKERSIPFQEKIQGIAAASCPPLDKIYSLTREFLIFYSENADLWRVLMHEMRAFGEVGYSAFNGEQQEKYRKSFEITLGVLESAIAEGIRQNAIKDCNTKRAAYGLFSAIVAIVFQRIVGEDSEETARNIASAFLFGVAVRA